jgi:hypothetical protein
MADILMEEINSPSRQPFTPAWDREIQRRLDAQSGPGTDDLMLVNWLKDRDAACPLCGYNIRGLVSPRCPECGQALRLSVTLAEPYLKAWIALIAALLPAAGVGAIFVYATCYAVIEEHLRITRELDRMPAEIAYMLLHLVSCIPLSIAAIVFRRRFLRRSRGFQKGCASAAWAAVALTVLVALSKI